MLRRALLRRAGQTDDGGAVPWVCGVRAAATAVLHNPLHEPLELQLVED